MNLRFGLIALAASAASALGQTTVASPTSATLRELWVDPTNGNDRTGDGSPGSPFRTMWRATGEAVATNHRWGGIVRIDIDGDGDRDLLLTRDPVLPRVFENVGSPTRPIYESRGTIPLIEPLNLSGHRAIDVDGDGDEDLVYRAFPAPPLNTTDAHWVENLGGMPPTLASTRALPTTSGMPLTFQGIADIGIGVGDIDGDGLWDIVSFEMEFAPGGCSGNQYQRAWIYRNVGTLAAPRFAPGAHLPSPSGGIYAAYCGQGSCVIDDVDGDGLNDLFFSSLTEIFFCRGRGALGVDDPIRLATLGVSSDDDLRFVESRGSGGEKWLITGDRKGLVVSHFQIFSNLFARRIAVGTGGISLGDPVPYAHMGELAPAPAHVTFRLAPGLYSQSRGEVFPWNLFFGASVIGAPGVAIDSGAEDAMHTTDMQTSQRLGALRNPPILSPAWGSGIFEFRDLYIRSSGVGIYFPYFGQVQVKGVRIELANYGILLGEFGDSPVSAFLPQVDAWIEDCHFRYGQFGVGSSRLGRWKNVEVRGCTFENCSVAGVIAGDRGTWRLTNNRFLNNRRGVHLESSRVCTPACSSLERLILESYGNHFADNVDHLSVVSLSSAGSNQRVLSWHDTMVGGGTGFISPASGLERAELRVRNAVLFPGGPVSGPNFALLDIGFCSVADPVLATQNGNVSIAPDFALSPREGHLVPQSALTSSARLAPSTSARLDSDGDERGSGGAAELGADEIRLPAVIGERLVPRGSPWTIGVLGPSNGWSLLLLATDRSLPTAAFGSTLWIDPLSNSTLLFPLALDARGVGSVTLPVPAAAAFPVNQLWAQALVGSPSGMELSRVRSVNVL